MKISSLIQSKKLLIAAFAILFAFPVLAQRHAMNDFFMDSAHRDKKAPVRDITFGFLSPINQHVSFAYEQALNYQSLLCLRVGIIGVGLNLADANGMASPEAPSAAGAYLSAGIKLFVHPDFVLQGMYRYNDMQGFYFNPEVIVGDFNYKYTWYNYNYYGILNNSTVVNTANVTNYGVILNLGKQWVFGNMFVLNIHAGIGYGGASISGQQPPYGRGSVTEMMGGNYYDYLCPGAIAYSGGVDIGILF